MTKTVLIISRHPATIAWIKSQIGAPVATVVPHINSLNDLEQLKPGDCVVGNLPLDLAAKVNEQGAEFWSLTLDYSNSPALRGKELNTVEFESLHPCLKRFIVEHKH